MSQLKKLKLICIGCVVTFPLILQWGCIKKESKKQSASSNIITKAQKTNGKIKPVSELIDWEKDKILVNTDGYGKSMVKNHRFLFYISSDYNLIRVNRRNMEKKILIKLKKAQNVEKVAMALTKNSIYYVYDNVLYQCDFDGDNRREILNSKDILKARNPRIVPNEIWGLQIYKNKIYILFGGLEVGRVYPKTRKIKCIAEDVRSDFCFLGDDFYYLQRDDYGINQVNLKTYKRKYVRGTKWPDDKIKAKSAPRYQKLMIVNGSLYYTCYKEGKEDVLYQYKRNNKDKRIKLFKGIGLFSFVSGYGWEEVNEKKSQVKIYFYNVKTKKTNKMIMPENFIEITQIVDDILIYEVEKPMGKAAKGEYEVRKIKTE